MMELLEEDAFRALSFEKKIEVWSKASDYYEKLTSILVEDIMLRYPEMEEYIDAKKQLTELFILGLDNADKEIYRLSEAILRKKLPLTAEEVELKRLRTNINQKITYRYAILGRKTYGIAKWNNKQDVMSKVI